MRPWRSGMRAESYSNTHPDTYTDCDRQSDSHANCITKRDTDSDCGTKCDPDTNSNANT